MSIPERIGRLIGTLQFLKKAPVLGMPTVLSQDGIIGDNTARTVVNTIDGMGIIAKTAEAVGALPDSQELPAQVVQAVHSTQNVLPLINSVGRTADKLGKFASGLTDTAKSIGAGLTEAHRGHPVLLDAMLSSIVPGGIYGGELTRRIFDETDRRLGLPLSETQRNFARNAARWYGRIAGATLAPTAVGLTGLAINGLRHK